MDEGDAREMWRRGVETFGRSELEPNFERALGLALETGLSGCDAQYVSLAEELGVKLVTADAGLARKLPQLCQLIG